MTNTCTSERLETMQTLMSEVLHIQRTGDVSNETISRIREIVSSSEQILEESTETHEKIIDAKIVASGSKLVRSHVQSFDTNLISFAPEEYTSGILAFVEGNSVRSTLDWGVLSSKTCCLFKKVPQLSYMLGTFAIDPPPPPEKIRKEREKRQPPPNKQVVASVEHTEETSEMSDTIYQHILKYLVIRYRNNGKKPVNYLQFVIDPTDYWRTVENIFHFAFLVRDNKVKMSLDASGLPVVEPILSKGSESASTERKNSQFNFRLSKFEWREIIDTFQISTACIPAIKNS